MKIAVHTIAKNEAAHVERWAASAADADLLQIADTGSTDGTPDIAADLGVTVATISVQPFRFDTARNAGLAGLPADVDVVVTLDMDEVLSEGWRTQLERAWETQPDACRWSYNYVWSWLAPNVPDVQFTGDRCITRHGWRWQGATHEVPVPAAAPAWGWPTASAGFTIEHHPDATKDRPNNLPLLEQAVMEEPHSPRQQFYLARELYFQGHWVPAREQFTKFLAMPEAVWVAERAEAYRLLAKMDTYPERWLLKAIAEDPTRRDALVDLVDLLVDEERWAEAAGMAARAIRMTQRPGDYMTAAHAYDNEHLERVLVTARDIGTNV